jgi:hypothetical protein
MKREFMRTTAASIAAGLLSAAAVASAGGEPVAIVYSLSGTAWIQPSSGARQKAERFAWLSADAAVDVEAQSTLLLAFVSGSRYELGPGARATLASDGTLRAPKGPVRALDSVPPLPRLAPLAERPPARAGALRIRGARIAGLYPGPEASAVPDNTVLSFEPLPGSTSYKVQVEDESGNAVFSAETQTASILVSPGVLRPGSRYHWTVRSLGGTAAGRGEADFETASAETLASRETLRRSLQGGGDAASLALLAEVDARLGLLKEAQEGFRAALARSPGDASLEAALARVDRRMADSPRDP